MVNVPRKLEKNVYFVLGESYRCQLNPVDFSSFLTGVLPAGSVTERCWKSPSIQDS